MNDLRIFGIIVASVALNTTGQLLLKRGMNRVGPSRISASAMARTLLRAALTPSVVLGFSCYAVSAVLWLYVLSVADLSWAYPLLSMAYVLVALSAAVFLGERLTPARIAGTLAIVAGVVLVAGT